MKKLILQFFLSLFLSNLVQGQNCDRLFETTITYDDDFLDLHYDNFSTGNHYKIHHRDPAPGETVNTDLSVIDIKKPIIVIEGYDIFFQESCDDIYEHYINYRDPTRGYLGDNLRANGYDIITYNLAYPMAALQPNALIFANFLQFINENKTGDEELIIMGVSMGGLISRYALTYMEENDIQHQTKLFLSFDSPQKGGYAPLSMQALLRDHAVALAGLVAAAADSPELAYLIQCFHSDGTLQMLTHHAAEIEDGYANPTAHHTNFFNELNTMNVCGGYPINCKSVAISNGSLNAETQDGLNIFGDYSGNPAVYFSIGSGILSVSRGLNTVPGIDNWMWEDGNCVYRGIEGCNSEHSYFIKGDAMPLDHTPGGYYPWYETMVEQLENISSVNIDAHYNDVACFVSTISALGLNTNDLMLNLANYSKNQILQDTRFDDIWWDTSHPNMTHTSYNSSLYSFVEDQIYLSEIENYAQLNKSISGGTTNSGDKKLYKASNSVTVENHTVQNGGQLSLKSGNAISLNAGFTVEAGATFSASIENINTRDCDLAGNLPQFTPASLKSARIRTDSYIKDTVIGGYNVSMYAPVSINSNSSMKEPTSVFDVLQMENFLTVYPNPTSDLINIIYTSSNKQNITIKLIEPVSGKTIKTIFTGDIISEIYMTDLDISNLSSGLYVILIQTEKGMFSEKFIKR
jgi:hypothetical protein